jgi:hypothetical protein
MRALFIIGVALSLAGCERYVVVESSPIHAVERGYILAIVLDTSGSFAQTMFEGDRAGYRFFLRASDQFFRDRMGENDRILITQLSAEDRTLLWEGPPLSLRRRFGNSASLRQFLEEKSNPGGSRAYAAVADTLDYLYELPGVSEGKTKVCVLVLSDMLDNSPTQETDRRQMADSLSRLAQADASIGFYWVDQMCLSDCRQCVADAGITDCVIECDVVDEPRLPSFQ